MTSLIQNNAEKPSSSFGVAVSDFFQNTSMISAIGLSGHPGVCLQCPLSSGGLRKGLTCQGGGSARQGRAKQQTSLTVDEVGHPLDLDQLHHRRNERLGRFLRQIVSGARYDPVNPAAGEFYRARAAIGGGGHAIGLAIKRNGRN